MKWSVCYVSWGDRPLSWKRHAPSWREREGPFLCLPHLARLSWVLTVISGSCVACGQLLSSKHAAGVYYLPCFHKYHPFCFSIVCATEPKCIVPDCLQDIPLVARCWALGNAYEESIGKACLFHRTWFLATLDLYRTCLLCLRWGTGWQGGGPNRFHLVHAWCGWPLEPRCLDDEKPKPWGMCSICWCAWWRRHPKGDT